MYWVNFLHIYQPIDQSKEILGRVVNESYRPLFSGFLNIPNIKINLNINGALTEILVKEGYNDIVENIKQLAQIGKLEFTESAKYHPLLPFLKKDQIIRQIEENRQTNRKYFGKAYNPICFFPPEMAYSPNLGKVVSEMGYKIILLDEISFDGGKNSLPKNELFTIEKTNGLVAAFRERRVSNCVMSTIVRNKKEFLDLIKDELNQKIYLCTAMDGETFGHHRPGMEKILFKIMSSKSPKQIFLSELLKRFPKDKKITPIMATWASTREDVEKGVQFYSWKDPKNKIHQLQWKFLNYILEVAKTKKYSLSIQNRLDRAMASDQFFWASGEPWWSLEMIEKGAWTTLQALKSLPGVKKNQTEKGQNYYKDILATCFLKQRSGRVEDLGRKYREAIKIPFKERSLDQGKPEVYYVFLNTMRSKMLEAAKKRNFERAILWRDAIWKLETKNDIYDTIHAVDLLRLEVSDSKLRSLMDKYKEKYEKIKPGQPETRKA